MGALSRLFLPKPSEVDSSRDTLDFAFCPGAYAIVTFFRRIEDRHAGDHILNVLAKPRDRQ